MDKIQYTTVVWNPAPRQNSSYEPRSLARRDRFRKDDKKSTQSQSYYCSPPLVL